MKPTIFGSGKNYLKSTEVQTGDYIVFMTEGEETESTKYTYPELTMTNTPHPLAGKPKKQFEIEVDYKGETKTLTMNKTSFKTLAQVWGYDTKEWVNKKAKITIAPTPNGKKAIYLEVIEE